MKRKVHVIVVMFTLSITSIQYCNSLQTDPIEIVNQFIVGKVGKDYFEKHYTPLTAEYFDSTTIKAKYYFNYPPYVKNMSMTIFYDTTTGTQSEKKFPHFLLDPQKILVDKEEAIRIATEGGIHPPTFMGYDASVRFGTLHSRLVWDVGTGEDSRKAEIDAETGKILVFYNSNQNGHSTLTYILIVFNLIILIISSYLFYRLLRSPFL